MIFQEPMTALDPVFTIGEQISEAYRRHFPVSRAQARERAIDALAQVGIPLPARRHDEYPHQLSGGMRQRVMIAMALVCEPKLLIADEPTTALDVTVQAQITDLLLALSQRQGTALMFITHDLGVVAEVCTRMLTMYAGEVVEDAPIEEALLRPRHPYTSGLLRSLPRLAQRKALLPSIPGRVPLPSAMPAGCRFRERCPHAQAGCEAEQPLLGFDDGRRVRCVRVDELNLPGAAA
jgi:peptide/nickel transport system ATP-binding protein